MSVYPITSTVTYFDTKKWNIVGSLKWDKYKRRQQQSTAFKFFSSGTVKMSSPTILTIYIPFSLDRIVGLMIIDLTAAVSWSRLRGVKSHRIKFILNWNGMGAGAPIYIHQWWSTLSKFLVCIKQNLVYEKLGLEQPREEGLTKTDS